MGKTNLVSRETMTKPDQYVLGLPETKQPLKKHVYVLYGLLVSTWIAFIVYGASNHLSKANEQAPSTSENYSCPSTWNEFTIDNRQLCMKYTGMHKIDLALFICNTVQAD